MRQYHRVRATQQVLPTENMPRLEIRDGKLHLHPDWTDAFYLEAGHNGHVSIFLRGDGHDQEVATLVHLVSDRPFADTPPEPPSPASQAVGLLGSLLCLARQATGALAADLAAKRARDRMRAAAYGSATVPARSSGRAHTGGSGSTYVNCNIVINNNYR